MEQVSYQELLQELCQSLLSERPKRRRPEPTSLDSMLDMQFRETADKNFNQGLVFAFFALGLPQERIDREDI